MASSYPPPPRRRYFQLGQSVSCFGAEAHYLYPCTHIVRRRRNGEGEGECIIYHDSQSRIQEYYPLLKRTLISTARGKAGGEIASVGSGEESGSQVSTHYEAARFK